MFGSNVSTASREIKTLVNEAERLINEANSFSGDKAEELQKKGIKLLSAGISKAHELENIAISAAKDAAKSTNDLVQENPWRAIAISSVVGAGIGLMLGMAISRK